MQKTTLVFKIGMSTRNKKDPCGLQVQEGSSTNTGASISATLMCCIPGFVQTECQRKCGKEKTKKDFHR